MYFAILTEVPIIDSLMSVVVHRAVDAAGMGVEIVRGRGEESNTFTILSPLILTLQPHPQLPCLRN